MKCFYHNDLDGHCSGALVKMEYPEVEMIEMDYGKGFPWRILKEGETVFMVDFSLSVEDMEKLSEIVSLIYIDHHVGILEQMDKAGLVLKGLVDRSEELAGCELTWKYFNGDIPIPYPVRLCGRFDMFDFSDSNTLPFKYAMESCETDPGKDMTLWENLLKDDDEFTLEKEFDLEILLKEGRNIKKYVEVSDDIIVRANAFYINFEGYRLLVLNSSTKGTRVFESIISEGDQDALMIFNWEGNMWRFGIYHGSVETSRVKCHKIAEKYGGGGHAAAAGWESKTLPFDLSKGEKFEGG